VENAVTEIGLHFSPPPAVRYKNPSPIGISRAPSPALKHTHTSGFPLLSGSADNLSDTLGVNGCSLCSGKGESEQEDRVKAEHCGGD